MNGLQDRAHRRQPGGRPGERPAGRLTLLASSAMIAIVAGASMAHGQAAFQGRPTFTSGNVSYSSPNNSTDVFTVSGPSTIIDWTPTDNSGGGTIAFLPAGKTGIFQSNTSPDFAVLNRINPADASRPIQFDGTVIGQYVNAQGAATPAGSIYFYTPGGIIVGATASFNVGNLILTTDAIDTTNGLPSAGGTLSFRGTSGSTSSIDVLPGGQISATNAGSYVALVAPRINQGGTVNVNGSVGYIAAEAADITINAGLFSIANAIGSQVAPGGETTLTHSGTTTGAAATATGTPHNIYMVAIPKNDAVTMLVSGNVGYQAATDASVVNGNVVLGAGYDGDGFGVGGGQASAINITAGTFTSDITAYSNGSFTAATTQGDIAAQNIFAAADRSLTLQATGTHRIDSTGYIDLSYFNGPVGPTINIGVDQGSTLSVAGGLQGSAYYFGPSSFPGSVTLTVRGTANIAGGIDLTSTNIQDRGGTSPGIAGTTKVLVDGGDLTITGEAYLGAIGRGATDPVTGLSADSSAGTASFQVINGGHASLTDVDLDASTVGAPVGTGGSSSTDIGIGGTAIGGTALLQASSGGQISISGTLMLQVQSVGVGNAATVATARGGTASLIADDGTITLTGATTTATLDASATGGNATGGIAGLSAINSGIITVANAVNLDASGAGGAGATLRAAGGAASIATDTQGILTLAGSANIDATGSGYDAIGGTASVTAAGGSQASFAGLTLDAGATATQDSASATGNATGGTTLVGASGGGAIGLATLSETASAAANSAGTATGLVSQGGQATLSANGGAITFSTTDGSTGSATLNAVANAGTATGGTARVSVDGGGTITIPTQLTMNVAATGGSVPAANGVDFSGDAATGGLAEVAAANGALDLASVSLSSFATGGAGVGALEGGNALGGTTRITTTGSNGSIVASGDVGLNSDGFTNSTSGTGAANGTGGTTEVIARGGSIRFADALSMIPDGHGASAASAGRDLATAGIGQGGTVRLIADDNGSIAIAGSAYLSPYGVGGGATSGVGSGTGVGGSVTVATGTLDGQPGTITFNATDLDAGAFGGAGGGGGGAAIAPHTTITVGAGGQIIGTTLTVENYAHGGAGSGAGAIGGAASGGTVDIDATGGALSLGGDGGSATITAVNIGGAGDGGGGGGAATAGSATISVSSGSLAGGAWALTTGATGGAGGAGLTGIGGTGGGAAGGAATISVSGGSFTPVSLAVSSTNTGGLGGAGAGFVDDPANPTPVQSGFAGGVGGAASGGTATVGATGGTITTGDLTLASVSIGGGGGVGGDGAGYSAATGAATGGIGGDGGASTGGGATLFATGGTIGAGMTSVTASGTANAGGAGGIGGTDPTAAGIRAQADGGAIGQSDGGAVSVATGNAGTLALGDTTLDASGAAGTNGLAGTITIQTGSVDGTPPSPAIALASFSSTNLGVASAAGAQLVQTGAPVSITGGATFNGVTGLTFAVAPTGGLTTGGAFDVTGDHVATSGAGTITAQTLTVTTTGATDTSGTALIATGGPIDINAGTTLATGDLTASGGITLASTAGAIGFGNLSAADDISVQTGGAITGISQTSTHGSIDDTAGGLVDIASLAAGDSISVGAGATGHFGTLTAGTDPSGTANDGTADFGTVGVKTVGDLTLDGAVNAYGSIGLLSRNGAIAVPTLVAGTGGSVGVLAGGKITLGAVTAPSLLYVGGPGAVASLGGDPSTAEVIAALQTAGAVSSGGAVSIAGAQAGSATIAAGTTLDIAGPFKTTAGDAILMAAGDMHTGDVTSFGGIGAMSGAGSLTVGNLAAGNAGSGGGIVLAGAAGVTAGNLTGVNSVSASSTSGAVGLRTVASTGGSVHITASGAISTLDVAAAGSIYLTGGAAITAGNLTAGTGAPRAGESGSGSGGGTDPSVGGIATGFSGATLDRCDDCYTDSVALPFTINYFGTHYSTTYVSNNGYLTFNSGQSDFTPGGLGAGYSGQPIVAPFFADVDTSNPASGLVTYGSGTFAGRQAFAATWNGVGYFSSHADKLNNFQVILTNRSDTGTGNFDIYYNYTAIHWETGDVDGGVGGLGGNAAAVGYNAGTGNQAGTYYELAGSRVAGTFINGGAAPLILTTNDGIPGQLLFTVRNGQVIVGGASEPPTIHVTNIAAGNGAAIRLGDLSAEAAEVHGAGQVQVGAVTVADKGSGIAAPGNAFATVIDAADGLSVRGAINGTGLVALGGGEGDVSTQAIDTSSSAVVLADGSVSLGQVTTGQAAGDSLFVSAPSVLTGATSGTGFDFTTLLGGKTFDPATLATLTPVRTGGAVTIAGPVSTGTLLVASGGTAMLGKIGAAGLVTIDSGGGITTADVNAAGDVRLSATGGDIGGGVIASSGGLVQAQSSGGIAVGGVSAATSVGLDATAGLLAINGAVDGTAITLSSPDIAIAANAPIGTTRTASLQFTNIGGGGTLVGADGGDGDYSLSSAELGNAHAKAITIATATRPDGSTPDTVIGDLALTGSAGTNPNLIGDGASFSVTTPGAIRLTGLLSVASAGSGDIVSLSAGPSITGVLPAAGIAVTDPSGALAGALNLAAARIEFDTPATQQAVASATTLGARDDSLAASDGAAGTGGYIRANAINFTVGSALYAQNSGAAGGTNADRAGVTAGAGGITIASTAATPVEVVLNGASGGATGADVIPLVHAGTGAGATTYAAQSSINGCLADGTSCAAPVVVVTPPSIVAQVATPPIQDVVQVVSAILSEASAQTVSNSTQSSVGQASSYSFQTPHLISFAGLAPNGLAPLIDVPVTGAGNDNLWVGVGVGSDHPLGSPSDAPKEHKPSAH